MAVETDLEAAIRLLAEGEERLREQIKLVQTLVRDGKPTDFAMDLCRSTRKTDAVLNVVGIRCGAISGNMKVSFQAARSIG